LVTKRPKNDLPQEVLGTVYWTEGAGYQLNVTIAEGVTRVVNVEFINDKWYLLDETTDSFKTDSSSKFQRNQFGVGHWPEEHLKNPKNLVFAIAPSFGDYLSQGTEMASTSNPEPPAQINMGGGTIPKGKRKEDNEETGNGGGLRGKAPELFDGDRSKSKAFISDMQIYFKIN
jgi:hypothetical protein